jgi:holo-[acyl-carrier protein] synthase
MICGIGVDLVRVDRLARALTRHGERFLRRVFTDREIAYCQGRARQGVYQFAQRFAAKEAFSKALGVGLREGGIRWREVEVLPDPRGKPEIQVTGRAAQLCEELGVKGMHLSLTDEDNLAVAMVVLET